MSLYLDFHFDKDCPECVTGCAHIIPKSHVISTNGRIYLSHDCCTMGELEHVLKGLEADIADIRKRAKTKFGKVHKAPTA